MQELEPNSKTFKLVDEEWVEEPRFDDIDVAEFDDEAYIDHYGDHKGAAFIRGFRRLN